MKWSGDIFVPSTVHKILYKETSVAGWKIFLWESPLKDNAMMIKRKFILPYTLFVTNYMYLIKWHPSVTNQFDYISMV